MRKGTSHDSDCSGPGVAPGMAARLLHCPQGAAFNAAPRAPPAFHPVMSSSPDPLHVCEAAARAGGRVLQEWVGRFKATSKGPRDLVTEADHASQAEVRRILLEAFPAHGFVGEEGEGGRPPLPPGVPGHSGSGTCFHNRQSMR